MTPPKRPSADAPSSCALPPQGAAPAARQSRFRGGPWLGSPPIPRPDSVEPAPAVRPPQVDSERILGGLSMVEINHNGQLYRLQATRQGKLILTK